MAFLLAVLGIAAAAAVWLIRANMAANAAKDLADTARDVPAMLRRSKWRQKAGRQTLLSLEDPREIATSLMIGVASADGEVSPAAKRAILGEMEHVFEMPEAECEELYAQMHYLTRDIGDITFRGRQMARKLAEKLTPAELEEFRAMLSSAAAADNEDSPVKREALMAIMGAFA